MECLNGELCSGLGVRGSTEGVIIMVWGGARVRKG